MTRVLIAEDEPRRAAFLEKGLRSSGFATTIVGDGPGASAAADESEFDLMVLDLGLPGKDGLEVLRDLRAEGSKLPVIILTARDDTSDDTAASKASSDPAARSRKTGSWPRKSCSRYSRRLRWRLLMTPGANKRG